MQIPYCWNQGFVVLLIFNTSFCSSKSKNHMSRKLILKNNETLCYTLKTCIVSSKKIHIHSAIFPPLSHKVHGSRLFCWADTMISLESIFIDVSIVCFASSFCLFIYFTSFSFSFLFRSFSDF